jgi:uncharacterized protein YndB with AHSA1/START domain
MMRLIRIFLLLLVSCYAYSQTPSSKEDYEIVRQDERIFLYERWADFPGTSTKARGIKVVFSVAATPDKMMSMVTEEAKLKEWQKNLTEFKRHPKNDTAWHVYTWYKMPWPLTDQDYYANYKVTERTPNRIVITFSPATNDKVAPVRDKINRMKAYGKWVFEKTTSGKTKVTYIITGEPVKIPRSVTDNIVRNNFMSTINDLIAVVEK